MRLSCLVLLLLAAFPVFAGVGSALSPNPVFSLDGQAHSARGSRLIVTPDERLVITAAHDRSIRLWEADSGQLVKRFFVPLRGADDGRIDALAISPDGRYLAVGGELGAFIDDAPPPDREALTAFDKERSIIIFALPDGHIHQVLAGLTARAMSLAWSADGAYLAAGLGGGSEDGLRIFATTDWRPVFKDKEFSGDLVSVAFRQDNTLVATGRGFVEGRPIANYALLYRPITAGGFRKTAQRMLPPGPARLAVWRPDGEAILAGADSLLSPTDLVELPGGPANGRSGEVSAEVPPRLLRYSPDGYRIIGGSYTRQATTGWLRRWNGDGRGAAQDFAVPDPRIADLAVLRSGAVVYLSEDGTVAAVSPDMKLRWRVSLPMAALSGAYESLRVSEDGRWISLPVDASTSGTEVAFHLDEPGFAPPTSVGARWLGPRDANAHLFLLAWRDSKEAAVGRPGSSYLARRSASLPLFGDERAVAVAVHATDPALVFGTSEGRIKKTTHFGGLIWQRELGADVVAVNLIESRAMVVAATVDGFVRLFRWSDGQPILSYHLQPAQRRWLAVAESGHFEAGIGAEDAAGWIVNRNPGQAADFFPLSRFRADYLLPGLVEQALAAGNERQGVLNALKARPASSQAVAGPTVPAPATPMITDTPDVSRLPPTIDILAPGIEVTVTEPRVRIRLRVTSPGNFPVTSLRARTVTQASAARTLAKPMAGTDEQDLVLDVPEEDSEIRIVAENRWGASVPAVVRVHYAGRKTQDNRGTLYVLAAGVSAYDKPEYRLEFAAKDARDFVASLLGQERGRLYRQVVTKILTDKTANRTEIEAGFAWLGKQVSPADTAMVFLAGHGINDGKGDYLYLPREADVERLHETGVPFRLIRNSLTSLSGRTLLFIDTCHSGNVMGRLSQGRSSDHSAAVNELASSENNIVVFASSTGKQYSLENSSWGNGAFTKALVEGLRGEADLKRRGRITYKQLDAYVSDRVEELTSGAQTPVTPVLQGVADFTIAEVIGRP